VAFSPPSTNRTRPLRYSIVGAVVVVALATAGSAAAQRPPDDISGVDQYTEDLPTGSGSQPTGTGGGKPRPLPPSVVKDLRRSAGGDADLLEQIATSPAFGAPGDRLSRSAARQGESDGGRASKRPGASGGSADSDPRYVGDVSFGEAVTSAVGALAADDEGGGPSPLLLALLGISGALVATAIWRARRNRA
jgi:hypothetical protein